MSEEIRQLAHRLVYAMALRRRQWMALHKGDTGRAARLAMREVAVLRGHTGS